MSYTEKQRKMFNAKAKNDPKMAELAKEANSMKDKPAKKAPAKKAAAKKAAPKKGGKK